MTKKDKYKTYLDLVSEGILVFNLQGDILYANKNYLELTGYTSPKLLKKTITDIIETSCLKKIKTHFEQTPEQSFQCKCKIQNSNNVNIYCMFYFSSIGKKDSSSLEIYASVSDISNFKFFEKLINEISHSISSRTGQELYNSLAKNFTSILNFKYALIGSTTNASPGMIKTLSLCVDDKIVDNVEFLLADSPCENVWNGQLCFHSKNVTQLFPKDTLLQKMGAESYLGIPAFNRKGEVIAYIAALHTEEVHFTNSELQALKVFANKIAIEFEKDLLITELTNAKELAEAANVSKTQFLSIMTHEIRTPLNALLGMSELLNNTKLQEEQKEFVSTLLEAGDSLLAIINDILDLSKIEAGKLTISPHKFNLESFVNNIICIFAHEAHKKNIKINSIIAPKTPLNLLGDENRIRQILMNLISNAIKFTATGEVILMIQPVSAIKNKRQFKLNFSVIDSGIGIPFDAQEKIFESFSQVDSSITRNYGGTGLGLTICQKLLSIMDSTMILKSSPDKGSTFSFTLSLKTNGIPKLYDPEEDSHFLSKTQILYIGKNEPNAKIVRNAVVLKGCKKFETVDDIVNAHDLANFNIVFIDLKVNQKILFQKLLIFIAESEQTTRFILMIPDEGLKVKFKSLTKGKVEFLLKPLNKNNIIKGLKNTHIPRNEIISTSQEDTLPPFTIKKPSILIVEDEKNNRLVMEKFLESLPIELYFAENGSIGLELYKKQHFDLIYMDILMPVLDGFSTTKSIREYEKEKKKNPIPIIALTALITNKTIQKAKDSGFTDYLSKPIKRQTILDSLENQLPLFFTETENTPVYTISLDTALKGLGDEILNNAKEKLKIIRESLKSKNINKLRLEAHNITGSPITHINKYGPLMSEAIKKENFKEISKNINEIEEILKHTVLIFE